jgi:glutamate synthase (NADPH/NADH) small chain
MEAEGTVFKAGCNVGTDITVEQLTSEYDAVVLAGGATAARDLPAPGRQFTGIYQAMEFLPWANRVQQGDLEEPPITAEGKHVVIVGGGDTGADCLGTVHRQGAASVTQLEILPLPPEKRTEGMPWPTYPMIYRVSSAHEEGGERIYAVNTLEFTGDEAGNVATQKLVEVTRDENGRFVPVEGSEKEIPAQLVLLAMGFVGPEKGPLLDGLGVELDARGNVARDDSFMTSVPGVFAAGDMGRGQSLIVWAIAEGRAAAAGVDAYLTGRTVLPRPINPTDRPLVA